MKNLFDPPKFVDFSIRLQGPSGNAFALMGQFSKEAKRQGWSEHEINKVIAECMSNDYKHLVATLAAHQTC